MAKVKEFSKDLKDKVIELFKSGVRNIDIAERLRMYRGTVSKIINKYKVYGTSATRPRSGRPKKSSYVLDRYIKRLSCSNPRMPATHIYKEIISQGEGNISVRTVQRRLMASGLFGRRPVKKTFNIQEKPFGSSRICKYSFAMVRTKVEYGVMERRE